MDTFEKVFQLKTSKRCEMVDITSQVQGFVQECDIACGRATVFCPHTTAAITINENADPDVQHDLLLTLDKLFPQHLQGYRHCEGNSDAHVKSSLIGVSEIVLIKNNKLQLGTWQAIFFCEFDGARNRNFKITVDRF